MSRHSLGERVTLAVPLPTLCCEHVIPAGCEVELLERAKPIQAGKMRVALIRQNTGKPGEAGGLHRVKASKIWGVDDERT